MSWILIALLSLVGLIAVVVVVGSLLPEQHVARRSARYAAAPATVWGLVSDFAGQKAWRSELIAVERVADQNGHEVWRETMKGSPPLELETIAIEPGRRLVRRIVTRDLPFSGEWVMELAPSEAGTTLTVVESGEVRNAVFRFVARFIVGYTATIDAYLKSLGRKLGETVVPA